jgi:hypothetical protein
MEKEVPIKYVDEANEPSEEEKQELLRKLFARAHMDKPPAGSDVQHPDDKRYYKLPSYQKSIEPKKGEEVRPIHHPAPKKPLKPKEDEPYKGTDIPLEGVEGPELTPHSGDEIEKMSRELSVEPDEKEKSIQNRAKEVAKAYLDKMRADKTKKDVRGENIVRSSLNFLVEALQRDYPRAVISSRSNGIISLHDDLYEARLVGVGSEWGHFGVLVLDGKGKEVEYSEYVSRKDLGKVLDEYFKLPKNNRKSYV